MWRFIEGIKQPPAKKTDEDKAASKKKYEAETRIRTFQESWLKKFSPWLRYDASSKLMFCTFCEKYAPSDQNFVKGCASLRVESLKVHAQSAVHAKSEQAVKVAKSDPGTTPIEQAVQALNASALEKLQILFRTCHALAKHCRPFADYVWLCELDEKKGLNIGQTYRTAIKCREFTDAISEVERRNLEKSVGELNFVSIMCDEATDSAVMEQLIIYIRYARDGIIKTDFLAIETVERATAQNCYDSILEAITNILGMKPEELWLKLVGFASDGAAVMRGVRNGVVQKLKANQPKLQAVHCIAHRLELAIKAAIKASTIYDKLQKLLLELYLFYHQSTLNRGLLRTAAAALGVKKFIPTRTGGTRWIGHTKIALENLFSGYPAIVQHLLEVKDDVKTSADSKGKISGFLKKLSSREVIEFGHFLLDVVVILERLSLKFQVQSMSIGEVPQMVADTVSALKKLKTRPGLHLRRFQLSPYTFHDRDLTGDQPEPQILRACIDNLVSCIEDRFTPAESSEFDLSAATATLDFNSWPVDIDEEFGDQEFARVVDYFGSMLEGVGCSIETIEAEWTAIKARIYKDFKPVNKASWMDIHSKYQKEFPNFLCLINLLLTIPAHSVECERGFSAMKKVKTDWRSRLNTDTLTSLMRILFHSASEEEFDPLPAITVWNSTSRRKRRPFQTPYKAKRRQVDPDDDHVDTSSDWSDDDPDDSDDASIHSD